MKQQYTAILGFCLAALVGYTMATPKADLKNINPTPSPRVADAIHREAAYFLSTKPFKSVCDTYSSAPSTPLDSVFAASIWDSYAAKLSNNTKISATEVGSTETTNRQEIVSRYDFSTIDAVMERISVSETRVDFLILLLEIFPENFNRSSASNIYQLLNNNDIAAKHSEILLSKLAQHLPFQILERCIVENPHAAWVAFHEAIKVDDNAVLKLCLSQPDPIFKAHCLGLYFQNLAPGRPSSYYKNIFDQFISPQAPDKLPVGQHYMGARMLFAKWVQVDPHTARAESEVFDTEFLYQELQRAMSESFFTQPK